MESVDESVQNSGNYRKRKRNPQNWAKEVEKRKRNSGKEYRNYKGVLKRTRSQGSDCACARKCFDIVPASTREMLFLDFWNLSNHDLQNAYIFGCVTSIPIKRRYSDDPEKSRRQTTNIYKITVGEADVQICKKAFLAIFGISNGRLSRVMQQKKTCGTPEVSFCVLLLNIRRTVCSQRETTRPDIFRDILMRFGEYCCRLSCVYCGQLLQ